jgi:hypothetical protein
LDTAQDSHSNRFRFTLMAICPFPLVAPLRGPRGRSCFTDEKIIGRVSPHSSNPSAILQLMGVGRGEPLYFLFVEDRLRSRKGLRPGVQIMPSAFFFCSSGAKNVSSTFAKYTMELLSILAPVVHAKTWPNTRMRSL